MTEISIHPFAGGFLINLTWVNGVKTSHDSSESELYESGIPKIYSLELEFLKSAQG